VLVESNLDQRRDSVADKSVALLVIGILKKLLTKVVAERIFEEVRILAMKQNEGRTYQSSALRHGEQSRRK
jgi:hypothetical protein